MSTVTNKITQMYHMMKDDHITVKDEKQILIDWRNELVAIPDKEIMMVKGIPAIYKIYLLNIKYDASNILADGKIIKEKFVYNKVKVFNYNARNRLRIEIVEGNEDSLYIEGSHHYWWLRDNYDLICENNKKEKYNITYFDIPYKDATAFGKVFFKYQGFKLEIPLEKKRNIRFYLQNRETKKKYPIKFTLGKFAKLDQESQYSYYKIGKRLIYLEDEYTIAWKSARKKNWIKQEWYYQRELLQSEYSLSQLIYRWLYFLNRALRKKDIWIISDRSDSATDNGKCFFEYLQRKHINKNVFFAINKNAADYKNIKKIGKVLPLGSFRYKLKFLLADKIISSHATEYILNAFGEDKKIVQDLYNFEFVFLQHGIIKDNYSGFLHKHKKNIKYFITSTQKEYDSILDGGYGYSNHEVILTGLARYDLLRKDVQEELDKKLIIMPTWRKWLVGQSLEGSEYAYNPEFINSEYYKFFQRLINDSRLIDALQRKNMTGEFYIHPILGKQLQDFQGNERIQVTRDKKPYYKIFGEGSLMLTDYSSVSFDFAYLRKPLVYTMFDYDIFYKNHTISEKGYFDYCDDGFGQVAYDYDSTIKALIDVIDRDVCLESKYRERIENFFSFDDDKNCERILNHIL